MELRIGYAVWLRDVDLTQAAALQELTKLFRMGKEPSFQVSNCDGYKLGYCDILKMGRHLLEGSRDWTFRTRLL